MVVFAADLDNTLIYSHRRDIGSQKVLVEYLKGKPQSYMTEKTYNFLRKEKSFELIPVTTRSYEQYKRIFVFEDKIECKYVLICNGGELLVDGILDEEWHRASIDIAKQELQKVRNISNFLCEYVDSDKMHFVSEYMTYAVVEKPEELVREIEKNFGVDDVFLGYDNRKIYVIARSINKGNAIKRLSVKLGFDNIIAAGDSEFDISLLEEANIAIAPWNIIKKIDNKNTLCVNDRIFSDGICDMMKSILNRGYFSD